MSSWNEFQMKTCIPEVVGGKIDGNDSVEDFPKLSEEDIRDITLGVYQVKLAKSYTEEHLENDDYYEVMQQGHQLIRVRMASRHTSSKTHNLWITYDDCCIKTWYCTCKAGARIVGTCSHISSVIWFLSFTGIKPKEIKQINGRTMSMMLTSRK
ncbi:unnamed protein product [Mytilus edulis]|uniref:SWIM-type domain-containing protein n=1 Tax=Mytilus edulis TaxID=6550 RepID=A0A8S3UES7_MYTED|nr:unnamed protein product [Mytilus edulis]